MTIIFGFFESASKYWIKETTGRLWSLIIFSLYSVVSLIQYFEADFLWKVSLKILNSGIILKTFIHVGVGCKTAGHINCFCLFVSILYIPVKDFSVMSGPVFLGWNSTKQKIKCLAQGHNTLPLLRLKLNLESNNLPLTNHTLPCHIN